MPAIKIATFNLENLFTRPTAMNFQDDQMGRQAIEDHATANAIADKEVYSQADKNTLIALSEKYKWHLMNAPANSLVQMQKIRGQLFRKPNNAPLEVIAEGRADWVGWFELLREQVEWRATFNTGRSISEDVKPDILVTVEVENRPTLMRFHDQVLKAEFNFSFNHIMVIDGNDMRGIDVGIMSKFPITEIRSHVDDKDGNSKIFSRDCPEFDILLPGDKKLVIIPNHFKSKRSGNDIESQNRRRRQAERTKEIALEALNRSENVLIAGDLNDTPASMPIQPLLTDGFTDVMSHPDYPTERPGTYDTGLAGNKIDYMIMSPALRNKLQTTGIERRGSYHPNTWASFDTVTNKTEEASDHHLVWATYNF